jgi:hypothetical protein
MGACSRHITNLKQSILETFDIYGHHTASAPVHGGQRYSHFLSVSDPWKNKLGQVEDENGKG